MLSASQELPGKGKRDLRVRLMDSARSLTRSGRRLRQPHLRPAPVSLQRGMILEQA